MVYQIKRIKVMKNQFCPIYFSEKTLKMYANRISNKEMLIFNDFFKTMSFCITRSKERTIQNSVSMKSISDENEKQITLLESEFEINKYKISSTLKNDFASDQIELMSPKSSCLELEAINSTNENIKLVLTNIKNIMKQMVIEDGKYFLIQREKISRLKVLNIFLLYMYFKI